MQGRLSVCFTMLLQQFIEYLSKPIVHIKVDYTKLYKMLTSDFLLYNFSCFTVQWVLIILGLAYFSESCSEKNFNSEVEILRFNFFSRL